MLPKLATFNAVLAANAFNPSIFRESWLLKQGVLREDEATTGSIWTDQAVSVTTQRYQLVVTPNQLVLTPASESTAESVLEDALVPLVSALPHTPFMAVGLNFFWLFDPEDTQPYATTRRLFAKSDSPLAAEFSGDDAAFGGYFSKNVQDARLRLEIKPAMVQEPTEDEAKLRITMMFNFQAEAPDPSGDDVPKIDWIIATLEHWSAYEAQARRIAHMVTGSSDA